MLPHILLQEMNRDCAILLNRALMGKTLACFGADGNGQHGTYQYAKHFTVIDILTRVDQDVDEEAICTAMIKLHGYDADDCGHVMTDNNLKISLNKLFMNEFIDIDIWEWGELNDQGPDYFVITLDARALLGW